MLTIIHHITTAQLEDLNVAHQTIDPELSTELNTLVWHMPKWLALLHFTQYNREL